MARLALLADPAAVGLRRDRREAHRKPQCIQRRAQFLHRRRDLLGPRHTGQQTQIQGVVNHRLTDVEDGRAMLREHLGYRAGDPGTIRPGNVDEENFGHGGVSRMAVGHAGHGVTPRPPALEAATQRGCMRMAPSIRMVSPLM